MNKKMFAIGLCCLIGVAFLQPLMAQQRCDEGGDPYFRLPLCVKKSASGTKDRDWTWELEKSASADDLTLSTGQVYEVTWTVQASSVSENSWTVFGTIEVQNRSDAAVTIARVEDILDDGDDATEDGILATISNCALPITILAGYSTSSLCDYQASGTGAFPVRNTVSLYDSTGNLVGRRVTSVPVVDSSHQGTITENEIDECVAVSDTLAGDLGTLCADDDPFSDTFTYPTDIGPYDVCGEVEVCNLAGFVTNDTGATGSAEACVPVTIPCEGGCTLTPGYWKTHSAYGPAPYDDTWALIGEDTPFFLSGKSWYEVLWTPPAGGNAYYILAHSYIAAKLNLLNGAESTGDVGAALAWAEVFFSTYTPASPIPRQLRATALGYATMLDDYNNGITGPGHCSE